MEEVLAYKLPENTWAELTADHAMRMMSMTRRVTLVLLAPFFSLLVVLLAMAIRITHGMRPICHAAMHAVCQFNYDTAGALYRIAGALYDAIC